MDTNTNKDKEMATWYAKNILTNYPPTEYEYFVETRRSCMPSGCMGAGDYYHTAILAVRLDRPANRSNNIQIRETKHVKIPMHWRAAHYGKTMRSQGRKDRAEAEAIYEEIKRLALTTTYGKNGAPELRAVNP